jgi:hypothetical protein
VSSSIRTMVCSSMWDRPPEQGWTLGLFTHRLVYLLGQIRISTESPPAAFRGLSVLCRARQEPRSTQRSEPRRTGKSVWVSVLQARLAYVTVFCRSACGNGRNFPFHWLGPSRHLANRLAGKGSLPRIESVPVKSRLWRPRNHLRTPVLSESVDRRSARGRVHSSWGDSVVRVIVVVRHSLPCDGTLRE